MLLNRFKILLLSVSTEETDNEPARMGKVRRVTLHHIHELAESVSENRVWKLDVDGAERERMLDEGKRREDVTEAYLLSQQKN